LCVHSGSRGFGEAILREHVAKFAAGGLAAESNDATRYLAQHDHAKRWASTNRELIAARMLDRLATRGACIVDICHNWVERIEEGWVHRKGAAPSTQGAVVIPGSRGALSYVVLPKEPSERSGFSLAHGAGRKWSRSESRGRLEKRFSAKDLTRTELGSHVICEDKALLYEEAPQAYKNITIVIDDLVKAGLAEVIAILKPLVTYKVRR
jgi:release factor H-coupled RctB family protein